MGKKKAIQYGKACLIVGVVQVIIKTLSLCEKIWEFATTKDPFTFWQRIYSSLPRVLEFLIAILISLLQFKTVVSSSIYEKIWELVILEEPVDIWQHISMILGYILEIAIAFILIKGSYTGNAFTAIPWLLTITPFFCAATMYAIFFSAEEDTGQVIFNVGAVVGIWTAWYIVLRFHLANKSKARGRRKDNLYTILTGI